MTTDVTKITARIGASEGPFFGSGWICDLVSAYRSGVLRSAQIRGYQAVTKYGLWRALLLLLAGTVVATGLSAPLTARAEDPAKVLLLLDVSGSMNEKISSGGTKFAAAKRALKQVADALPAGTEVGLRVYGSEIAEPKAENPKACQDTELVMPIGPLNRTKMYRAVDSFKAVGETPIAYSLGKAVDDLGDSGRRVLVLISDGEESCAGDPCPVARKLADKGVDLQFNAVGLDVGGKARKQLKCIADAGNGSYYDADESDDLSEALRKITQRALRPFAITGTRVSGNREPGRRARADRRPVPRSFRGRRWRALLPDRAAARRDGDRDGEQPRPARRHVQRRRLAADVDHRERCGVR